MISEVFQDAACRNVDPELHFPAGYGGAFDEQVEEAKQVCRSCPILAECLDYALANPDKTAEGIWAATTPRQRRRRRAAVAA